MFLEEAHTRTFGIYSALGGASNRRMTAPKTWKEMQERYLGRIMGGKDEAGCANGTRRRDFRRRKLAARAPLEIAVATAELSVGERLEAEEARQSAEELRVQLRDARAEALSMKEKAQTLEFRLQEARAFSIQQEKTIHSLSTQLHRKERQVRSMLKLEHGRLIRLITRFILAVNGVSARVDRLRDEVRAGPCGRE